MKHVTVYQNLQNFAGWPANHGHWQWSNELLCGFMVGKYDDSGFGNGAGHMIQRPYMKMLARSFDGGETWRAEIPNASFECREPRIPPLVNLRDPDTIIRVCGVYDTGGETCHPDGGFYLSIDRGKKWTGPYRFHPLAWGLDEHFTGRTCVLGNRVFVSLAKRKQWGTDYIVELTHDGEEFAITDTVCKDVHRAVMPAVAYLPHLDRTVIAARRKGNGKNWIDTFGRDGTGPWRQLWTDPLAADTGWYNGNPPALASIGENLFLAYGNRGTGEGTAKIMQVIRSKDGGVSWDYVWTIASSSNRDLGYPRLFARPDGKLVCVYYIATGENQPCHIEACIFDPAGMM